MWWHLWAVYPAASGCAVWQLRVVRGSAVDTLIYKVHAAGTHVLSRQVIDLQCCLLVSGLVSYFCTAGSSTTGAAGVSMIGAVGVTGEITTGGTMTGGTMTDASTTGGTAAAVTSLGAAAAEAGAEAAAVTAAEGAGGMPAMCSRSVWAVQQQQMCGHGMGMLVASWIWVPLVVASAALMRCSGWVVAAIADAVFQRGAPVSG